MSVLPFNHKNDLLAQGAGVNIFRVNANTAKLGGGGEHSGLRHIQRRQVFKAFVAGEGYHVFHKLNDIGKAVASSCKIERGNFIQ